MSLIAEFRIASPKLALYETRQAVPDLRLEVEQEVGTDPERPLFFFWAERGDGSGFSGDISPPDGPLLDDAGEEADAEFFQTFEDALDEDPTTTDEVVLDRFANRRLYRVQFTEAVGVLMYPKFVGLGAEQLYTVGTADGWHVRMRFPGRESLTELRRYCVDRDVTFDLRRAYGGSRDADDGAAVGLTDCQREAVEAALRVGYFDVPRGATLESVADELDVTSQSASERLRRGVRTLARNALGDGSQS